MEFKSYEFYNNPILLQHMRMFPQYFSHQVITLYMLSNLNTMNTATTFILFTLRILGLDPFTQNRISRFLNILVIFICVVIFLPYLIEIVFHFDGIKMIDKCQLAVLPFQIIGIIYTFIGDMCDLLNTNNLMWPAHKFGYVLERKILANRREALIFVMALYVVHLCMLGTSMAAHASRGNWFFLGYRQCETKLCCIIQILLQVIMAGPITVTAVVAYFAFFWILISECVVHFELLRYGIKNITPENIRDNFMDIVAQHIEILRFIKLINRMYSSSLLVGFVLYPTYIIIGLFSMTLSGVPTLTQTAIKYLPAVITCLSTLLIFCIAGEVIKIKSESVCRAIYEMDWLHQEAKRNRLDKDIVLMLQMAQNSPCITIHSFQPLNLNTYLQVLKFCYSVYSFFVAIK